MSTIYFLEVLNIEFFYIIEMKLLKTYFFQVISRNTIN